MKEVFITCLITLMVTASSAQELQITFQSQDQNKKIDSIRVTNLNTGKQIKLFATDTLILTNISAIGGIRDFSEIVYPNPCCGVAQLRLFTKTNDNIKINIYGASGQILSTTDNLCPPGGNIFKLNFPGNGIYLVSARSNNKTICKKVICLDSKSREPSIEFSETKSAGKLNQGQDVKTIGYSPGDVIHFLVCSDDNQTVFTDSPSNPKNYNVEFFDCMRADSKGYKTVKIGEQIWMAENLAYLPNVSDWKDGSNNDPYYYVQGFKGTDVNEAKEKDGYKKLGVLYNLPAALRACPDGWHLPSDLEWDELAQYISDQKGPFQNNDTYWYEVGNHLKASYGWYYAGENGTDDFGFSALPGGERTSGGNDITGSFSNFWSSTAYFGTTTYFWYIAGSYKWIKRTTGMNDQGLSVRCIKDGE